ncbi:MAG: hypothetical protein ACLQI7_18915 [Streptosporangiaceae bacterium]
MVSPSCQARRGRGSSYGGAGARIAHVQLVRGSWHRSAPAGKPGPRTPNISSLARPEIPRPRAPPPSAALEALGQGRRLRALARRDRGREGLGVPVPQRGQEGPVPHAISFQRVEALGDVVANRCQDRQVTGEAGGRQMQGG